MKLLQDEVSRYKGDIDIARIYEKELSIPTHKRTLSSVFKAAVFKKPTLIIDVLKVFAGV